MSLAIWLFVPLTASADDAETQAAETHAATVKSFLGSYCIQCHEKSAPEGEREFESFRLPIDSIDGLISADEIIDQLTLRQMPPADVDQPSDEQRLAVVTALRESVAAARDRFDSTGGRTVIRRLSHREYENTLEALFGRRVDTLGLTAEFPLDNMADHIDTIGDALVTSGFLLDLYFQAADRLVERRLGKPVMEAKEWHFTDHFVQYEELQGSHKAALKYKFLCLYEQPNSDTRQGGYGHIEDFLQGVPVSGLYDIEVSAQAMHRDTHYDPKIFRIDLSEPFRLAVVPGDVTKGHIHYPQAIEPILATSLVPDDKPEWLKFRIWLEAGQTPRFIFPNGPYESRASVLQINKRYKDEFKGDIGSSGVSRTHILREGKLPHIRIGEIKLRGPLPEPDGVAEEVAVFGPDGFQAANAVEQLNAFARRAFRRPLEDADLNRIESFYNSLVEAGSSPRQAALDSLKMILCSPSFLYLREITDKPDADLNPFDLASRMSYAVWAGPPDKILLDAAASGKLTDPSEIRLQIERMLADERSAEFVSGFLDSWLNLRDIGSLPPPRQDAPEYYAEALPVSMKAETRAFFRHLLETNGSVADLLDSNYAFIDKRLAKLYRLPAEKTLRLDDGFQKVDLEDNSRRGGLLGMAAVLTVSANGVDTSPVTRGVWVSENILGITPPTPPDEVPAIEADVSGAKTIREKLAKHSADQACQVCHQKIDPLGFGLETFDPIGRWRNNYPKANGKAKELPIDSSGSFTSGESYKDFAEYKRILRKNHLDRFTKHLIATMLAYSTGRRMERVDQFEIEDIAQRVKSDDYGLKTLVNEVFTSEIFRSP